MFVTAFFIREKNLSTGNKLQYNTDNISESMQRLQYFGWNQSTVRSFGVSLRVKRTLASLLENEKSRARFVYCFSVKKDNATLRGDVSRGIKTFTRESRITINGRFVTRASVFDEQRVYRYQSFIPRFEALRSTAHAAASRLHKCPIYKSLL